jgi:hypothetical protein
MVRESLDELVLLDKRIAERPISLPDHPFIAELKDFGMDELYCAGIDVVATGIAGAMIHGAARMAVLPFVGPVLEKGAFFVRHAYDANKIYNTTPKNLRQSRSFYFKEGVKHGFSNLAKDICIHDPIYASMVAGGLYFLPDVPPFLLSFSSYVIGVLAVVGLDVANKEHKFRKLKKTLSQNGFFDETYWESRFFIRSDKHPEQVMEMMSKEFGLAPKGAAKFHDVYIQNVIPALNGRAGKLRLRTRDRREFERGDYRWGQDSEKIHTLQLVYSRAKNNSKNNHIDQFNYYPVEKTKICYMLDKPAFSIDQLTHETPKSVAQQYVAPEPHYRSVLFERSLYNSDQLAVCTDAVQFGKPCYLLELKVYNDTKLLQQAMRYVMLECPIVALQTTHSKCDMFV